MPEKEATSIQEYLKSLSLEQLLKDLGAPNPEALTKTVIHFTAKEAQNRDKIVISYFGKTGIKRIANTITEQLLKPPKLPSKAKILDVGAGTGFFTIKVAKKLSSKTKDASFYAMDLTPAMLASLTKKRSTITPFFGIAENIKGSIAHAHQFFDIPQKFDALFSTLMLHHSLNPENVFESMRKVLKKDGKAVIIDLCKHSFKEFEAEMGDVHLGFDPRYIQDLAEKSFGNVQVAKMSGIFCQSSGRSAELFVAVMKNRL